MTIAQPKSALEQCRDALAAAIPWMDINFESGERAIIAVRAAIAAAEAALAAQGEPVAWANSASLASASVSRARGGPFDRFTCSEGRTSHHDTPLYAAPVAAPVAQPLTDEQITACVIESKCHGGAMRMAYESGPYSITQASINAIELTRAIERAHGIAPKVQK